MGIEEYTGVFQADGKTKDTKKRSALTTAPRQEVCRMYLEKFSTWNIAGAHVNICCVFE